MKSTNISQTLKAIALLDVDDKDRIILWTVASWATRANGSENAFPGLQTLHAGNQAQKAADTKTSSRVGV